MDMIKVKDGTQIYFKDWGSGQPLFFHHGWPLSADDWDTQMMFFLGQGLPRHRSRSPRARPLHADRERVTTWIPTRATSPKSQRRLT